MNEFPPISLPPLAVQAALDGDRAEFLMKLYRQIQDIIELQADQASVLLRNDSRALDMQKQIDRLRALRAKLYAELVLQQRRDQQLAPPLSPGEESWPDMVSDYDT